LYHTATSVLFIKNLTASARRMAYAPTGTSLALWSPVIPHMLEEMKILLKPAWTYHKHIIGFHIDMK
jgi:hypothetical protein